MSNEIFHEVNCKKNHTSLIKFMSFSEQQSKEWLKLKIIEFEILDLVLSMSMENSKQLERKEN